MDDVGRKRWEAEGWGGGSLAEASGTVGAVGPQVR